MDVEWADSGSRLTTSQAHQWKRYITDAALALIRKNGEDSEYGELLLEVPSNSG
jgi:hypothetical protein